MDRRKRRRTTTLTVDDDVFTFIQTHGHHRVTDFAAGRVNVSAEFNEHMRRLMARVSPESIGFQLAREKVEMTLRIEAIDREVQELFGVSTIDEWLAQQGEAERKGLQQLQMQRKIRDEIQSELWERVRNDYGKMRGGRFTLKADQSWMASRFKQELRTLNLTAVEALARVKKEISRGPEVA